MSDREKKQTAKIKLATTIRHPDQERETFELWVEGTSIQKQGQSYLTFEEVQDAGNIRTTVRMGDNEALILRGGAVKMRLPFLLNKKQRGSYDGGFGSLAIMVDTKQLHFSRDEANESGRFLVEYNLLTDGQLVGEYTLEFTYTEEKS